MAMLEALEELRRLCGIQTEWRAPGEAEKEEITFLFKQFELLGSEIVELLSDVSGAVDGIDVGNGEKKKIIQRVRTMKSQIEAVRKDARKLRADALELAKQMEKPAPKQAAAA